MTSPVDTFKNNLFGQLKSYTNAVQNTFEQRIARPLLALKRDIIRSSSPSETRSSPLLDEPTNFTSRQETLLASTPLEIIDIENDQSMKTISDKVNYTKQRHGSVNSLIKKDPRTDRLRQFKSVSFADNYIDCSVFDRSSQTNENHIVISPSSTSSIDDEIDDDFQRRFHRLIRPRRISIGGSGKDLVCQDLSAEIVAYVLKHALKICEKEDQDYLLAQKKQTEDYVDLK